MKTGAVVFIVSCLALSNCSKKNQSTSQQDTNILTYRIENSLAKISIDPLQHVINITFPDSITNGDDLIADFTLSPGCKATIKNVEQVSGITKNDYSNVFVYTISAGGNSSDWRVTSINNNYTAGLGLGNFIQKSASNDCSYPWYMDQAYTGPYSNINCGPTCVTMACKWSDSTFSKTPEDARNVYRPGGGDWYADDITFYLRDNNIPNSTLALPETADAMMQILKRQVDLQQAVILLLEMNLVRFTNDLHSSHADRFYTDEAGIGHFIIIKGYKMVDNEMYLKYTTRLVGRPLMMMAA